MKRKYGLFEKKTTVGKKVEYERLVPKAAFYKDEAVRCFQSLLLGYTMQGRNVCLRPVKV